MSGGSSAQEQSSAVVRADWLCRLNGECQRIIGDIQFADRDHDPVAVACDLTRRIPDPVTAIEERLLRGQLLELGSAIKD